MANEYNKNAGERERLLGVPYSSGEPDPREQSPELSQSSTVTLEDAIEKAGFGKFQIMFTLISGLIVSGDVIQMLSVSFIIPEAGCDMRLSSDQKGLMGSFMLIGMTIGGFLWGFLSDRKGRRVILLLSLFTNFVFALATSFCQQYVSLLAGLCLTGVGSGGVYAVIFSYYPEFLPVNHRGKMVSFLGFFWLGGSLVAAGLAWFIIPNPDWGYVPPHHGGFHYSSWRIYMACCSVPCLLAAFFVYFLPESPKYLVKRGRVFEAIDVLNTVHRINNGENLPLKFEPNKLETEYASMEYSTDTLDFQSHSGHRRSVFSQLVGLFLPPFTSRTAIMCIQMCSFSFAFWGILMWLPTLLQNMQVYGGSPCSVAHAHANSTSPSAFCLSEGKENSIDHKVYRNAFITGVSMVPGGLVSVFFIDNLGRKPLMVGSTLIAGVSVIVILFVRTKQQAMFLMCAFSSVITVTWNVYNTTAIEVYPTDLRSLAMGFLSSIGKVASIVASSTFGALIEQHCAALIVLVGILVASAGLCSIFLPNMANRPIN